jgi:4-carboxymuconolactone decarboxylase
MAWPYQPASTARADRKIIDSLADISPEVGHQMAAWAFGEM